MLTEIDEEAFHHNKFGSMHLPENQPISLPKGLTSSPKHSHPAKRDANKVFALHNKRPTREGMS